MQKKKNYFLIGIGGNGMQPLALILKHFGANVYGSDRAFDLGSNQGIKKELEDAGIILSKHDGSGITEDIDEVIITRAIDETTPYMKKARSLNLPMTLRPKALGDFFKPFRLVGIAGTAGKTTTTAMVGHILKKCGKSPTIITGSEMTNYGSRVLIGTSNIIVAEIDESGEALRDQGFYDIITQCYPEVGIVLNIGNDHFKNIEDGKAVFKNYAKNHTQQLLVRNSDCINSSEIKNDKIKTLSFGTDNKADYKLTNVKSSTKGIDFEINGIKGYMPQIGKHNALNATTACVAASHFDITLEEALNALKNFKGTKQRLTICDQKDGITSICDFAHTTEEIEASLGAIQEVYKRVFLLYQPHGMGPHTYMKPRMEESFNRILRNEDKLFLLDAYRKDADFESSKLVADTINNCEFLYGIEDFQKNLPTLQEGDAIVIMGARDPELFPFAENILKTI